jgi:opacity protein-like surface antigen
MKSQNHRIRTMWLGGAISFLGLAALSSLTMAGEASAQVGLGVEGRAGVTFPQGDLSDAGAEAGLSLGAEVQANVHRNVAIYVGFHRHAFSCDDDCTLGENPRSTGLAGGLKYIFHSPGDVLAWARVGAVANTFGNDDSTGDREVGFEVGAGFDLPVASRISLVPSIGFIVHDAGTNFRANFFTLGLGVQYHLRTAGQSRMGSSPSRWSGEPTYPLS